MSRSQLIAMAKNDYAHGEQGTVEQTDDVYKVPAANYVDEARFEEERQKIFRRLPLMLAATAEVPNVGDYKAMEAAGMQVLITRARDGQVRAHVNMCSHRGARLMPEGCGTARKFTCPYHAWTFSPEGDLVAVYAQKDFGDIEKADYALTALPCLERAGLIWVVLDPQSTVSIETFLCGYDAMLNEFGFAGWHHQASQVVPGPNWKVAYDGYLDYYHLPILHGESFGTDMHNQANYYSWGPHMHLGRPDVDWAEFLDQPDDAWPTPMLLRGVWTIFPHISIASFDGGGRSVMISQLFPGATVGESYTVQHYLMEEAPTTDEQVAAAKAQFDLLKYVVAEEDYATGLALQKNLAVGAKSHVLFGRNEAGGQRFHKWVDSVLSTDDADLDRLFQTG